MVVCRHNPFLGGHLAVPGFRTVVRIPVDLIPGFPGVTLISPMVVQSSVYLLTCRGFMSAGSQNTKYRLNPIFTINTSY